MLISVGILFGGIFLFQIIKSIIIKKAMLSHQGPAVSVSTAVVTNQNWQPKIKASGSLRAVQGVDVTTEIAGLVRAIRFIPGSTVTQGDTLVELNNDAEIAELHARQASAELAKITYNRDKEQFAIKAISQATLDTDMANVKNTEAQVAAQAALLAKKTILAPFSGKLGICLVNLGQYLNPGDKIVTLQSLDPIYVDFYVPQQKIVQLEKNQSVILKTDSYPNKNFEGKITTINPAVDSDTRNIEVEATLANPENSLLPGMFGQVEVDLNNGQQFLTVPQTAISFNPYGELVYIVKETKDKKGKSTFIAAESFVTVGEKRGDQIAVLTGLKEGDVVVTSGQLKLKNGSFVVINNSVIPTDNPHPTPVDE